MSRYDFEGDRPAKSSIWVTYGHRVYEISAWRLLEDGKIIATIPGHPHPQILDWCRGGASAWPSEIIAHRENLVDIDAMRLFYDDLAERTITSIERIKREEISRDELRAKLEGDPGR